jgi:hypothetical protein
VLKALTFQWQTGKYLQTLPTTATGSKPPVFPKPAWKG